MIVEACSTGRVALDEGQRLLKARQLPEALQAFAEASSAGADPDRCSAGVWLASMLLGDFEAAWCASDAIRRRGSHDPHRLWQGEAIEGRRVMLRCLHGFGDAMQFLRYAPRLRALASQLIVEVHPRFVEVARRLRGVDEVICWGEGGPSTPPVWDVQIEVMELPYLFRTQLGDLPIETKYLRMAGLEQQGVADRKGAPMRVGLEWTAGEWNPSRQLQFEELRPFLELKGCEFWSLRHGPHGASDEGLREDAACGETIEGLAARIAQLDLVITVDTLAAHMAGAMGVPVWVLLEHAADWRWMHEQEDSPWYPSMRLFRQARPGEWSDVIGAAAQALRQQVVR